MVLHGRTLNKELTENAKEYNPLWIKVLEVQASEEEGTPVITWCQIQWDDLEAFQDFKNGMLSWLGVDWEEILDDEDAAKGITNWKRRYTHQYK